MVFCMTNGMVFQVSYNVLFCLNSVLGSLNLPHFKLQQSNKDCCIVCFSHDDSPHSRYGPLGVVKEKKRYKSHRKHFVCSV